MLVWILWFVLVYEYDGWFAFCVVVGCVSLGSSCRFCVDVCVVIFVDLLCFCVWRW